MLIAGSMYNMKKIFGSLGQVISGPPLEAQAIIATCCACCSC